MNATVLKVEGDYQGYTLEGDGNVIETNERMAKKIDALHGAGATLNSLHGKSVLDVGTDHGFWAFIASAYGARRVLGLDRNRSVRGRGAVDLIAENNARARLYPAHQRVTFEAIDLGKSWREFGQFDVVFAMSVYHHIYANCGDHDAVWYWLWRHCNPGATLIWEGPIDTTDVVVQKNVPPELHARYNDYAIIKAASRFFDRSARTPALHEPTREVWVLTPKPLEPCSTAAYPVAFVAGAGGATPAFLKNDGARIADIEAILGYRPYPGSLNCRMVDTPFEWGERYYRAELDDVNDRSDPDSRMSPRWCRFYPVTVGRVGGHAMRFEGEKYPLDFVEVIGPHRFRDLVPGEGALLWHH